MNIRKIQVEDAQNFLEMKKKLDRETKFMLIEPQERRSTTADIEEEIRNFSQSDSLELVAECDHLTHHEYGRGEKACVKGL